MHQLTERGPRNIIASMQGDRDRDGTVHKRAMVPVRCVSPGSFAGTVLVINHDHVNPSMIHGDKVIMVPALSVDYSPIAVRSLGVISMRGGSCSHLAVILREMGLPGVVLCDDAFEPPIQTFIARYPGDLGQMEITICEC